MGSILVTPAKLISELVVTHLKLWHALEIDVETTTDAEIGKAKRKIIQLNARRTKLENEIDENFKNWFEGKDVYEFFPTLKDYSRKAKRNEI